MRDDASQPRGRGRYTISVAAEMVEVHPQTLRHYEGLGLISPQRGRGDIRYFSPEDIDLIFQIRRLIEDLGVNLAGVEVILNMQVTIEELRREHEELMNQMQAEHDAEVRRLKEIVRKLQGAQDEEVLAGEPQTL